MSSDDSRVAISFNNSSQAVQVNVDAGGMGHELQPVFIPTKGGAVARSWHAPPDHDRATVEMMIFDDGYIDLAELLARPGFEDEASSYRGSQAVEHHPQVVGLVGGRYLWTNGGAFRFEPGRYEETDPARSKSKTAQAYQDSTVTRFVPKGGQSLSSSMTAEGIQENRRTIGCSATARSTPAPLVFCCGTSQGESESKADEEARPDPSGAVAQWPADRPSPRTIMSF